MTLLQKPGGQGEGPALQQRASRSQGRDWREGMEKPGGGWMWAMLAGWVVRVGPGKDDQAQFSGPGQLGGLRGQVHIKGAGPPAAGMAPPFPAQLALPFDVCGGGTLSPPGCSACSLLTLGFGLAHLPYLGDGHGVEVTCGS